VLEREEGVMLGDVMDPICGGEGMERKQRAKGDHTSIVDSETLLDQRELQ